MRRLPKHAARKRRTRKQKLRAQARLLKYIERVLLGNTKPTPLDVSSIFGRTGAIAVAAGDYASSQPQSASEASYTSYARTGLVRSVVGLTAVSLSLHTEQPHGDKS